MNPQPVDACQKIYKKDFLKDIRFIEDNPLADIPFHWESILSAKKVFCIEKYCYIKNYEQSKNIKKDVPFFEIISISNIVFKIFPFVHVHENIR